MAAGPGLGAIILARISTATAPPGMATRTSLVDKLHQFGWPHFVVKLFHSALLSSLIRPPLQEFGTVPKALRRDLIVKDLDNKLGFERMPVV
jgi:hypothetical protein